MRVGAPLYACSVTDERTQSEPSITTRYDALQAELTATRTLLRQAKARMLTVGIRIPIVRPRRDQLRALLDAAQDVHDLSGRVIALVSLILSE